jgi:hypothetical protein
MVSGETIGSRPSLKLVGRLFLRNCLERRDRLIDDDRRQFIFEEARFLRRKRCRIVERRSREIDRVGIFRGSPFVAKASLSFV